jgi:3-hydroxyisobutyrate dehydrogenase-like beta-hydroxyacid dehydrogenase
MMAKTTVALLHPGEMGAAVGACARERGARVVWASDGRSPETRARAEASGLEDLKTLPATVTASDVVLSVCPPHGAVDLARAVAALGFRGVFVDANAVAPQTAREIARIVEGSGATFVDGGIVGPPPGSGRGTRLYLAGKGAERVAGLFTGSALGTVVLEGAIGAASALKVCYAAWTKGATALIADVRALAAHAGVDAALVAEWKLSQPEALTRSVQVTASARKAWRWIAEMEEIAATFAEAGLPDGFHRAAADIYARLERYQNAAAPPALTDVTDALRGHGGPGGSGATRA